MSIDIPARSSAQAAVESVADRKGQMTVESVTAPLGHEEEVSLAHLLERVRALHAARERFVTATCLDLGEKLEVLYHFDQNLELTTLRLTVGRDEEIPSLSGIYLCAFLIENEMKELFGLRVKDIAIDYGGRLMLTEGEPVTPMLKAVPSLAEKAEKKG